MARTQQAEHTDSISSQDPQAQVQEPKKAKSRRPPNTAFRQQRLKAWQPILTPKTVLPLFFIVGVIFTPIGGLLIWASYMVQELSIDYTGCITDRSSPRFDGPLEFPLPENQVFGDMPADRVTSAFTNPMKTKPQWAHTKESHKLPLSGRERDTDTCYISFNVPDTVKPPVLFYYRLTNFYQNHRRYVSSLDMSQLKGDARTADEIRSGACEPLDVDPKTKKPYYPCGLIANSMFNDTFDDFMALNAQTIEGKSNDRYEFSRKGIAWSTEGDLYGETKYKPQDVVPPPYWQDQFENGSYEGMDKLPDLHEWEEFQVWMRTAGLPTFSKLAMRNDKDELKSGDYVLKIHDMFPVDKYGGKKGILISTRTVMGGKNTFLGIAYIVVGGLCILLGAVFTATHLIKPRKLGDHTYLSWNNDQPSTATTTGRSARPGDNP
ncbi:LEM3/CDC50 family protein [Massariosphaeria phaeospora]|uniref:LEM3/CDC50 family protein n=1 Tax=Massariosphaeria phaeospora TaxID=100035 RepID=A0A7C8M0Z3_9PLEO|nr:LEM3/CDC50 family protein [Massariosphaeria phaeospora]